MNEVSGTRTLVGLLFVAGMIVLQVYLSRREGRFPGLVLPIISFIIALLFPLNMAVLPGSSGADVATLLITAWLLANIPTVLLLGIYFGCRSKRKKNKPVDRMNIQDLD